MTTQRDLHCGFCRRGKEVENVCGRLWHSDEPKCTAHQKCMQYSACLCQYETKAFGGFKVKQVLKEQKRGGPLKCSACTKDKKWKKVGGATAGCAISKCNKSFHFYCAATTTGVLRQRIECSTSESEKPEVLYRVFCSPRHKILFEEEQRKLKRSLRDVCDSDAEKYDSSEEDGGSKSTCKLAMSSNSSPASVIVNTSDKEPAEDKSESTNQPTNCKRDRQEFELDASQESVSRPRNDCILAKKRKLDNAAEKESGKEESVSAVNTGNEIEERALDDVETPGEEEEDELRCSTDGGRDVRGATVDLTKQSVRELCPCTPRIQLYREMSHPALNSGDPVRKNEGGKEKDLSEGGVEDKQSSGVRSNKKEKQKSNKQKEEPASEDIVVFILENPSVENMEKVVEVGKRTAWKTFHIPEERVFLWQYNNTQDLTPAHMIYLINDIAKALVKKDEEELECLIFDEACTEMEPDEEDGTLNRYNATVMHNASSLSAKTREALYQNIRCQIADNMRKTNEQCEGSNVARFCNVTALDTHFAMIRLCNVTDSSGEIRSRIMEGTADDQSESEDLFEWKYEVVLKPQGEDGRMEERKMEYEVMHGWMESEIKCNMEYCKYPQDEVLSRNPCSDGSVTDKLYDAFVRVEDHHAARRSCGRTAHVAFVMPSMLVFYVPYVQRLICTLVEKKLSPSRDVYVVLDVGAGMGVISLEDLISPVYLGAMNVDCLALTAKDPKQNNVSAAILKLSLPVV